MVQNPLPHFLSPHTQCPVLHLSLSPHGGRFLLAQDLEGGLALFAFTDTGDAVQGPLGGGRLAALPLEEAGLPMYVRQLFVCTPKSLRLTSKNLDNPTKPQHGTLPNRPVAEAAWWSPSALAVVDKKGHAHVLRLLLGGDDADGGLRFRPLLSTDMPIGRGVHFCISTSYQRRTDPTQPRATLQPTIQPTNPPPP